MTCTTGADLIEQYTDSRNHFHHGMSWNDARHAMNLSRSTWAAIVEHRTACSTCSERAWHAPIPRPPVAA